MSVTMIDEIYEFSAPKFFDFIDGETEEDVRRAELWFEKSLSYAPSPFMPRIKTDRSANVQISLLNFGDADNLPKVEGSSSDGTSKSIITDENNLSTEGGNSRSLQSGPVTLETRKEDEINTTDTNETNFVQEISIATEELSEDKKVECPQEKESVPTGKSCEDASVSAVHGSLQEACTPNPQTIRKKQESELTNLKKNQTAKKIASLVRNPSALKTNSQLSQAKGVKPTKTVSNAKGVKPTKTVSNAKGVKPPSARSVKTLKNVVRAPDFSQENQAIKRQKLDEGRSRQILNIHPQNLPHKSRLANSTSNLCSSIGRTRKEDRKVYAREPAAPFVSTAELVKRFQSSTRNIDLPHTNSSLSHDDAASTRRPNLTLTRPMEPALETSQRVRSVRVKSSAELEEEMMAQIPKFKARPVNKKILEMPSLPALPRSTPKLPEFQEFHLKTMERANQHAETSTVVSSTESACQYQWKPNKLTEPKTPRLETSLRARPPKVKSTQEMEQEELEKIPKFKARPLNTKIFESKGTLGMFSNSKHHVTKPQEFHFATDARFPPPKTVFDLFDKLSLNSEPHHEQQHPRITTPNPFHLHTEERGAEKEKKFVEELLEKQYKEERARLPKATPYPYTTDYPVIPPKPEPKQCTQPEPFQLESLTRHEEELKREMEERQRVEREEAKRRVFKAKPILKEDPIPVPEKERIPLTQVQEFELHVNHRAVDRAEFDKKIKEKEMMYKRYRDESESARMMEEEKALKQLRRTMVPHARPVPKFDNPFHPQKSTKGTTKAKSPNLRVTRRKERRTMFGAHDGLGSTTLTATSAAASNMR